MRYHRIHKQVGSQIHSPSLPTKVNGIVGNREVPQLFVTLAFLFALTGCSFTVKAEDVTTVKSDIAAVQAEIKAAQAEGDRYTGGLIKSLIDARIAVFRQTEAMLQQRLKASMFGVSINYTVDGKPFVAPASAKDLLAGVEQEAAANLEKIKLQKAETERYSGGLVHAMSLSTLATMMQTQAMLEQRRVSLKYGLPQYIGFNTPGGKEMPPTVASGKPAEGSAAIAQQQARSDELGKAIAFTVLEKGFVPADPSSQRYQALLTLKCSYVNGSAKDIRAFTGAIAFQDLFGREIYKVSVTISDPVKVGEQATWSGTVNYNQFIEAQQRFRAAELRDMKVVWVPASIIFSDGTKVGIDSGRL